MLPGAPPVVALGPGLRSRAAALLGCHGIPDRCPVVAGRRAPICARCLGFLVGNLLALGTFLLLGLPGVAWAAAGAVALVPGFADATLQAATGYRSTNPRRLATGVMGGFGQIAMLAAFAGWAVPRIAAAL